MDILTNMQKCGKIYTIKLKERKMKKSFNRVSVWLLTLVILASIATAAFGQTRKYAEPMYHGQSVSGEKFVYYVSETFYNEKYPRFSIILRSGEKFPAENSPQYKAMTDAVTKALALVAGQPGNDQIATFNLVTPSREYLEITYRKLASGFPDMQTVRALSQALGVKLLPVSNIRKLDEFAEYRGPWRVNYPTAKERTEGALPTASMIFDLTLEERAFITLQAKNRLSIFISHFDPDSNVPGTGPYEEIIITKLTGGGFDIKIEWFYGKPPKFQVKEKAKPTDWWNKSLAKYAGDLPIQLSSFLPPEVSRRIAAETALARSKWKD